MSDLRKKLVRLAYTNESIRPHLLPLLTSESDAIEKMAGDAKFWPEALERALAKGQVPVENDDTKDDLNSFFDGAYSLIEVARNEPAFRKDMEIQRIATEVEQSTKKLRVAMRKYLWE
jgi:hypothetical protein